MAINEYPPNTIGLLTTAAGLYHPIGKEIVDWAYQMLQMGYDTPHLYILAGVDPSEDYSYFKIVLKELDIAELAGAEAVFAYCAYLISCIANDKGSISDILSKIRIYVNWDELDGMFNDFLLLYWEDGSNEYWPGITPQTLNSIATVVAKKWLTDNQGRIDMLIHK